MSYQSVSKEALLGNLTDAASRIQKRSQAPTFAIPTITETTAVVGRIHLLFSTKPFRAKDSTPFSAEDYLKVMNEPFKNRFAVGLGLGIVSSTLNASRLVQTSGMWSDAYYLHFFNTFTEYAGLTQQPDPQYQAMSDLLRSNLTSSPQAEGSRLKELIDTDPTFSSVLLYENLPLSTRIHLDSLNPFIMEIFFNTIVPVYSDLTLKLNPYPELTMLPITDRFWLQKAGITL